MKPETKLYVRNMVCNRCIMAVRTELENLGYDPISVSLGEVVLDKPISPEEKNRIGVRLIKLGFSIIDNKKAQVIERIKNLIVELVHERSGKLQTNLSDFLSEQLDQDYNNLTTLFSEVEGTTIEKYFIAQKIARVKELLVYDELTLSEIAFQLNYSSVAHLSNQFKKVTGLTPSHFKRIGLEKRKPLDQVK
jgi:AraC-like DNA-binding protein/copper chaperone CopZ